MSRLLASTVLALLALTAVPFAQNDVSGAWDLTINTPNGPINAAATLKQDGEKLTGKITGPEGDVDVAGTMKGKALALAFTVNGPQGSMNITVSAEVDGANMKGMMDFGQGTMEITGKKK